MFLNVCKRRDLTGEVSGKVQESLDNSLSDLFGSALIETKCNTLLACISSALLFCCCLLNQFFQI